MNTIKILKNDLLDLHFHGYSFSFSMRKLDHTPKPLLGRMLTSTENCQRAAVKMGLGTDIFGSEFKRRAL